MPYTEKTLKLYNEAAFRQFHLKWVTTNALLIGSKADPINRAHYPFATPRRAGTSESYVDGYPESKNVLGGKRHTVLTSFKTRALLRGQASPIINSLFEIYRAYRCDKLILPVGLENIFLRAALSYNQDYINQVYQYLAQPKISKFIDWPKLLIITEQHELLSQQPEFNPTDYLKWIEFSANQKSGLGVALRGLIGPLDNPRTKIDLIIASGMINPDSKQQPKPIFIDALIKLAKCYIGERQYIYGLRRFRQAQAYTTVDQIPEFSQLTQEIESRKKILAEEKSEFNATLKSDDELILQLKNDWYSYPEVLSRLPATLASRKGVCCLLNKLDPTNVKSVRLLLTDSELQSADLDILSLANRVTKANEKQQVDLRLTFIKQSFDEIINENHNFTSPNAISIKLITHECAFTLAPFISINESDEPLLLARAPKYIGIQELGRAFCLSAQYFIYDIKSAEQWIKSGKTRDPQGNEGFRLLPSFDQHVNLVLLNTLLNLQRLQKNLECVAQLDKRWFIDDKIVLLAELDPELLQLTQIVKLNQLILLNPSSNTIDAINQEFRNSKQFNLAAPSAPPMPMQQTPPLNPNNLFAAESKDEANFVGGIKPSAPPL